MSSVKRRLSKTNLMHCSGNKALKVVWNAGSCRYYVDMTRSDMSHENFARFFRNQYKPCGNKYTTFRDRSRSRLAIARCHRCHIV